MNKTKAIPNRAHPLHRREPLPWHLPKSPEEDPQAPERVGAILNNPSCRRADDDVDFLATDGMRGVRLQIDYLKPELLLEEHRVRSTIVVFGSTRILIAWVPMPHAQSSRLTEDRPIWLTMRGFKILA